MNLRRHGWRVLATRLVGGFYLVGSGVHIGIAAADPGGYETFADVALLSWVSTAWHNVFMADPRAWGLAVAAGELAIGSAVLAGGRWTRLGLLAAIGFHCALLLFGWWAWVWAVPMLALLVTLVRTAPRPAAVLT